MGCVVGMRNSNETSTFIMRNSNETSTTIMRNSNETSTLPCVTLTMTTKWVSAMGKQTETLCSAENKVVGAHSLWNVGIGRAVAQLLSRYLFGRVVELVDTRDLKSLATKWRAGSIPASTTKRP